MGCMYISLYNLHVTHFSSRFYSNHSHKLPKVTTFCEMGSDFNEFGYLSQDWGSHNGSGATKTPLEEPVVSGRILGSCQNMVKWANFAKIVNFELPPLQGSIQHFLAGSGRNIFSNKSRWFSNISRWFSNISRLFSYTFLWSGL